MTDEELAKISAVTGLCSRCGRMTADLVAEIRRMNQIEDRITTLYEFRDSDNEATVNTSRATTESLDKLWERVYAIEEKLGIDPLTGKE